MKSVRITLILILVSCTAAAAACPAFHVTVEDHTSTPGFDLAAQKIIEDTLAANGCDVAPAENSADVLVRFYIRDVASKKNVNPVGMALAGGLSSTFALRVDVSAELDAVQNGQTVFHGAETVQNSPHDLYSGWYRARSVKKHTVETAAAKLAIQLLKSTPGQGGAVVTPPRSNGDFLNEDRDVWPILGGGFTMVGFHEIGHLFNARLLGHSSEIRSTDERTFEATFPVVAGFSVLFSHRLGDDMQFPLPDALYDFHSVSTPSGVRYLDDGGMDVSHGRRDHALIAYSGILFQNLANEYLLTKHPHLIDQDNPFRKGMFWGNIIVPGFYTFQGYSDPNSDLYLLQQDLGWSRWAVNTMVLTPLAIDMYRYYHPEKKKLRRYSRIAKLIPVLVCLTK